MVTAKESAAIIAIGTLGMLHFFLGVGSGCIAMYFLYVKWMIKELNRLTRMAHGLPENECEID